MARRPHLSTSKNIVLRRPLSITSILLYQRRRHKLALLEAQMDRERWRVSLAVRKQISPMTGKQRRGYELKAGNYRVNLKTRRWILF